MEKEIKSIFFNTVKFKNQTKIETDIFEKNKWKNFKSNVNKKLTIISSIGSLQFGQVLRTRTQTRTNFLLFEKSKPKLESKSPFLF